MNVPAKFYRTRISIVSSHSGSDKAFEADLNQVDFHKLLGRYTLKYDPPIDMLGTGPVKEYEFYKRHGDHTWTVSLRFWEINEKDMKAVNTTMYTPKKEVLYERKEVEYVAYQPPVIVKEPNPPQINALLEFNVLRES